MNFHGWLQFAIYLLALFIFAIPLGLFMAKVFENKRTFFGRLLEPIEKFIYRIAHIDPSDEMDWKVYGCTVLLFNLIGLLFLYLLLRFQNLLPLNPQGFSGLSPDLAFNTAITYNKYNWQTLFRRTTLSIFRRCSV